MMGGKKISKEEWARMHEWAGKWRGSQPPPPGPPKRAVPLIFGYRRCSDDKQAKSQLGLQIQQQTAERYADLLRVEHPELEWGEWLVDEAVSAYQGENYRLLDRPDGQKLRVLAQAGDHVIFAKFDRAFRNTRDALDTLDFFKRKGVVVHFADLRVDLSTAIGELIVTVMAAVAQMESRTNSDRHKALSAYLKAAGRPYAGNPRTGWKRGRDKHGRKRHEIDWEARAVMGEVLRLHDEEKLSFVRISDRLEAELAGREGRRPREVWEGGRKFRIGEGRRYTPRLCAIMYHREKKIRAETEAVEKAKKERTQPSDWH